MEAPPQEDAAQRLSVVILTGAKGSGKSTVARRLIDTWGYYQVSFAAKLREYMEALDPMVGAEYIGHAVDPRPITYNQAVEQLGYDAAKARFPELRRSMQRMGTELFRNKISQSYWTDAVQAKLLADQPPLVVCDDCRFNNELDVLQSLKVVGYDVVLFRIERDHDDDTNTEHQSETESRSWRPDFIVPNRSDLDALLAEADDIGRKLSR